MNRAIVEEIFPGTIALMDAGRCPHCKKAIGKFRDDLSQREFEISGLCQKCQDSVFGSEI